jgi:hypothetical protein
MMPWGNGGTAPESSGDGRWPLEIPDSTLDKSAEARVLGVTSSVYAPKIIWGPIRGPFAQRSGQPVSGEIKESPVQAVRAGLTRTGSNGPIFVHTEEVTGSIPVSPTQCRRPVPVVGAGLVFRRVRHRPART